ncbi:MAG: hypothetical protein ABI068_13920 [Ktedonobacterales bacterium]
MNDDGEKNVGGAWPEQSGANGETPNAAAQNNHGDTDLALNDDVALELQAREALDALRETMGDLGGRVRQAIQHAATVWDEVAEAPEPQLGAVSHDDEVRARAITRRWVKRDVLVELELPSAMSVTRLLDAAVWRVELRERGETRELTQASEPYRGATPPLPGPTLPLWDYDFATPEIEAGERRERIAGAEVVAACGACHGSGHRSCAACEGQGKVPCANCHGRGRLKCPRCRGRGQIADAKEERRARASKSYLHVHAERMATDATERLADFAETLRQEYGVPLPPSAQWAPTAPASGKTIPCPDCVDGTIPCRECVDGKAVCKACTGTSYTECSVCAGTGKVLRRREIARRFDTRIGGRTLPAEPAEADEWFSEAMLRRSVGEEVWEGDVTRAGEWSETPPTGVPAGVWVIARALARSAAAESQSVAVATAEPHADEPERRVIARRLRLSRTPLTRINYTYSGRPYSVVAVGVVGSERFWTETFPPRWSRMSRFVRALARDLSGDIRPTPPTSLGRQTGEARITTITEMAPSAGSGGEGKGAISDLDAYRARRAAGDASTDAPDTAPNTAPSVPVRTPHAGDAEQ